MKLNKKSLDIVTNMFFAAQQRNINEVKDLLKYEVALPPPSLTKPTTGKARFAQKAKLGESLVTFMHKNPIDNAAIFMGRGIETVVIDASVMIRKHRPKKGHKTFAGYAMFLKEKMEDEFFIFDRVDIVFDQYFDLSIKSMTRGNRGAEQAGTRYHVYWTTPHSQQIGTSS